MKRILLFGFYAFALFWSFGVGILSGNMPEPISPFPKVSVTPSPTPQPKSVLAAYDVLAVTQEQPHKLLYIESVNFGTDSSYAHAYYYDGTYWQSSVIQLADVSITNSSGISQSSHDINLSITIGDTDFSINAFDITTGMTVRSRGNHQKFGGATTVMADYVTIDSQEFPSHVGMLVTYKDAPDDPDILDLGISTDWLMYWDGAWNFHHLDITTVEKYDPRYLAHSFYGVQRNANQNIIASIDYYNVTLTQSGAEELIIEGSETPINLRILLSQRVSLAGFGEMRSNKVVGVNGGVGLLMQLRSQN